MNEQSKNLISEADIYNLLFDFKFETSIVISLILHPESVQEPTEIPLIEA